MEVVAPLSSTRFRPGAFRLAQGRPACDAGGAFGRRTGACPYFHRTGVGDTLRDCAANPKTFGLAARDPDNPAARGQFFAARFLGIREGIAYG